MFPYFIDVALTAWISSAIVNRYDYNGIAQYQNRRKKNNVAWTDIVCLGDAIRF